MNVENYPGINDVVSVTDQINFLLPVDFSDLVLDSLHVSGNVEIDGNLTVQGQVIQPDHYITQQVEIITNSNTIVPLSISLSGSGSQDMINAGTFRVTRTGNVVAPNVSSVEDKTANISEVTETYTRLNGTLYSSGDIASNWNGVVGNSLNTAVGDISALQTKTQNIAAESSTQTNLTNDWRFKDSEDTTKLRINANGMGPGSGNTVLITPNENGIQTGYSNTTKLLVWDSSFNEKIVLDGTAATTSTFNGDSQFNDSVDIQDGLAVHGHTSLNTVTFFNAINPLTVRNSDDTANTFFVDPVANEIIIGNATQNAASIRFPFSDATITYNEIDIPQGTFSNVDFTGTLNAVTATELSYVEGVTSSIQTQLDSKIGNTGDQSITGTLTVSGNVMVSNKITLDSNVGNIIAEGTVTGSNLSGTNTGDQNLFSSVVVSGEPTVTPSSTSTALTLVAGTNVSLTTDNTAKSVTINSTASGSFNPTITSAASSDMILYNSVSTNWENALVPWKSIPTITASGNLLTVTAPTYVVANVNTSSYDAQLSDDSGFSNILNTWTAQVSNQFDTTAYVTDGNTYYFRARANTDWGSRKTQYTTGTSFVAAAYHSPVAAWGWLDASAASRDPSGYDGDTDVSGTKTTTVWNGTSGYRGVGTWYSGLGRQWSQAQVSTVAIGQADSLGAQAISGNPSYTFTSVDGMALHIGSTRSYLVFDLGSAKSCAKYTVRAQYTSTPGGWTPIDTYFRDQILEYWNGSSWVNLTTFSGTYTSGQVISATFSTQNIRYYRLGSNTSNRHAIATQVALSAV